MRNVCELINGMRKMVDFKSYLEDDYSESRESEVNDRYRHCNEDTKGILTGELLCGARKGVEVAAMVRFHLC